MSIRILIADDHSVVRKGVRMLLEDETDIQIIGEAADGDEAIDMLADIQPDVLLLDITMPRMSGIDALKVISQQYPKVRTLMFSMHNNPDYILKAVQNGAAGYLLKDTGLEEILRAVRSVVKGDLYYPPNASSVIIRHLVIPNNPRQTEEINYKLKPSSSIWNKITSREAQILTCLIDGMSSQAIADRLGISPNTVANQRASIMRKVGVKNTVDLIRIALQEKSKN
ncbi:response regulator transcription factor [Spirosoma endophyticum]|uniref:Two component transcriptional regulator, LuxR family n=1 Tax=Spirosoma endophyticum TaxID=662367 RepID=A0A1I1PAV2_9BACT|nr:response regulator transcription factor [Spirosoma endophyticum]SFD04143.1 two component transcriptional regulator, LuxR family [Spirosoma endophyticum]